MRIVNILVFLIIVGLSAWGGYNSYESFKGQLASITMRVQEDMVRGFAESTWKMHRYKMEPLLATDREDLSEETDVVIFTEDVSGYFKGMNVDSVQVFGPAKQTLTSFPLETGKRVLPAGNALLDRALATKTPASNFVVDGYRAARMQTAVPLLRDGKVELIIVLVNNVSARLEFFTTMLAVILGSALIALVVIMVMTRITVRRAENVIARQFEENTVLANQAVLAQEENQQKSQFLANISHELRTPLNAIIGFSDILKNEFVPAPGQSNHVNYIGDIHSAGTHLLSLINDILDYSKAEAGKLELEVTEVNVIKMIQNCLRLVQPRAEIAQVRLLEALPKDAVVIITDGKKFRQVLLNLLSNAVKFTRAGGVVKVSTWANMKDDTWVFEVSDTGIGIAPKDISRAMSPFGQVDNALSRKFEGTGLGLPLTKKFVELMGGKFAIESEVDKGTTVTFTLPREFKPQDGVIVKQVA